MAILSCHVSIKLPPKISDGQVQGNGYEDSVVITPVGTEYTLQNVFNNVLIVQGDSLDGLPVGCAPPTGDAVSIDGTTINSNLFIFQNVLFGEGSTDADPVISGDGPDLGNNVVTIATTPGLPATADQGVVGEWTYIYQGGANNTVVMGGSGDVSGTDFETGFLDIYTGDGGGGFVLATNTSSVTVLTLATTPSSTVAAPVIRTCK